MGNEAKTTYLIKRPKNVSPSEGTMSYRFQLIKPAKLSVRQGVTKRVIIL